MPETYHVHVYKVSGMLEFDILADSEEEATAKALGEAGRFAFQDETDCKHLAIIPAKPPEGS